MYLSFKCSYIKVLTKQDDLIYYDHLLPNHSFSIPWHLYKMITQPSTCVE